MLRSIWVKYTDLSAWSLNSFADFLLVEFSVHLEKAQNVKWATNGAACVQSITPYVHNVSEACRAAPSLWDVTFKQLEDSPDALHVVLALPLQASLCTAIRQAVKVVWVMFRECTAVMSLVGSKLLNLVSVL